MTTWTREAWAEATHYGEEEWRLVHAIRAHLLTPEQNAELSERGLGIEDLLNGRVEGDQSIYDRFYSAWNQILGWSEFGF